ncbi:MAG: DUF4331 family protein [Candidatus Baltobacteraceae bacterium]|jgi:hypothetical protein
MKIARLLAGVGALGVLCAAALLFTHTPARSFDLQDSPATVNRPGAAIADTYFFPSPTNSNNVVAVMDVHPLIPAGQGASTYFDQGVLYTMKFDNNFGNEASGARPVEDLVIQISFGAVGNGTQQVFVYGPAAPNQTGTVTTLVNGGTITGTGLVNKAFSTSTGLTVFAGARQDPFFFDLQQFYKILPDRNLGSTAAGCLPSPRGSGSCPQGFNPAGSASNFFSNVNVLSIVIEIPKSTLIPSGTGPIVAYWATTSTQSGN